MSEWFYTLKNQQHGPIPEESLRRLLQSGQLDPYTTYVWRSGMSDWVFASRIPELITIPGGSVTPSPVLPIENPSSTQVSTPARGPASDAELRLPAEPVKLDFGFCFETAFAYIRTRMGLLVGATALTFGFLIVVSIFGGLIQVAIDGIDFPDKKAVPLMGAFVSQLLSNLAQLFVSLGVFRLYLNLLRGRPAEIGDIFSQGSKLPKAVLAQIIYFLLVVLGLIAFVIPGVWIAARLIFCQYAIVEKNLGPIESLKYSFALTRGNSLILIATFFVAWLIVVLGLVLCCLGLLWTIPISGLVLTIAFLFLHGGSDFISPPQQAR